MDPIKLVYRYKNNSRRLQYHIYIFIGDVPPNISKILKKIQDKQLYDSFMELADSEFSSLNNFYGSRWYTKLFNTYHINHSIDQIRKNKKQQDELIKKFGQGWYDEHIKAFELMERKILYNYATLIKDDILRKEQKRKKLKIIEEEPELDYTTSKTDLKSLIGGYPESVYNEEYQDIVEMLDKMAKYDYNLLGGTIKGEALDENILDAELARQQEKELKVTEDETEETPLVDLVNDDLEESEELEEKPEEDTDESLKKEADDNDDGTVEFDEGLDQSVVLDDEELDLDELEKIYQDTDAVPDKNITQTATLIKEALKDDKIFKKAEHGMIDFDVSKDNLMFDESLKNVFYKNYVTSKYIFKDDTVKAIKDKIATTIKNNQKFDSNAYIIPSRQYLWSEYFFEDKLEKIMIGQKWIKRSDMLNIDIEPNVNIRFYEELRGNLKFLRDNIRRYGSKIKREDDDYNILYDYEGYYTNNEIYMIDIYNELGKGYNADQEALKNFIDVYVRIYFPRIRADDINYIIDYLNDNTKVEVEKVRSIYETINGNLIMEKECMMEIEQEKKRGAYKKLFKDNYITQSVIHVNLRTLDNTTIDLFRIFNEFIVNNKYPFIQYQTIDGQKIFKYSESDIEQFTNTKKNIDLLTKWFERAPYGISFKVKISEKGSEKFMAIDLFDNGRVEYKTQWKEDDMATIDDIKNTYVYVRELIEKLNSEKNRVKFDVPLDAEFKYAFINTIQKFELPGKFSINHNDLSEFARYFYPYVALVVEPRKRQSKIKKSDEKGKFGTYLCYKRISKYENQARIEQRILYFVRNYDYTDQILANEISKQFNITVERSLEEIERVKNKYPNIKKSRKILKKLENIPKYKTPGIRIDIQGKQRDRYKIRVSGARNKDQLDRIIAFYGVLIYLYVETYLYKRPEKQILKEKLKKLTNIAKRRNRVDEIVDYEKEKKTVKQMAVADKKRIGFKPEKGENQWTRSCQNSGNDKRRRPQQFTSSDDLLRLGFKFNNKAGVYEKKIKIKNKKDIILRAVGLDSIDEEGNVTGTVYYTCSPESNDDHMFVGFLSKSSNPYGQCMPCCFKKDALDSKNKEKKDYYMKCIGKTEIFEKAAIKQTGDKLYILQDTNKIQEGRIGFLPKYLDYYLNQLLGKSRKYKNHYLLSSETGYFFKHGSKQEDNPFMNACTIAFDMSIDEIKNKIIERMIKDKSDVLFTALNNGDIKTSFLSREKYIDFIKNSNNINFDAVNHILSLPGVIKQNGLNIIVFKKETLLIKKILEKEKVKDDFIILCQNIEEVDNVKNMERDNIILFKEHKNYNPVVLISRRDKIDKGFKIVKTFKYENKKDNVINHIYEFYKTSCDRNIIGEKTSRLNAKILYKKLLELSNDDYKPQYQVIDARNKCKYLITKNATILPIKPSGSIYDLPIIKNVENKLQSFDETIKRLNHLNNLSKDIRVKPIGIYYDFRKKNEINVVGIMTELYELAPIVSVTKSIDGINKLGFVIEYKQLFDQIDLEIAKGKENYQIDDRISNISYTLYYNESYELFRLHLSYFLKNPNNELIKNRLVKIMSDKNITKKDKKNNIRGLLFRIIDKNLKILFDKNVKTESESEEQIGGRQQKLVYVLNKMPALIDEYEVNNNREICYNYKNKNECSTNKHCYWAYDECQFALTRDIIISFVNKVSDEFINNERKAAEILQKEGYFVSDIADYNRFEERPNQKIIKSTNVAINKTLSELFGKDNIPVIGKKKLVKTNVADLQEVNITNPIESHRDYYVQKIIPNNITLLRAFANGYNWLKHAYYDFENKNFGFYSTVQTDMANYFRSNIIDWINDKNNYSTIVRELATYLEVNKKNFISTYINKISQDVPNTKGVVELYILNKLYNIPVIVYDKYNNIMYIFDGTSVGKEGIAYAKFEKKNDISDKKYNKYKDLNNLKNFINIRFTSLSASNVPLNIEVAYYK
jgi:hypothetical protein